MAYKNNQKSHAPTRERMVALDRIIENLKNEIAQAENELNSLRQGPGREHFRDMLTRRITNTRRELNQRIEEAGILQRMFTYSLRSNFNPREVVHLPELLRRTRSRGRSGSRNSTRSNRSSSRNSNRSRSRSRGRRCTKGKCTVS